MLLGGRGCWATCLICLANPALLGPTAEVQWVRMLFSPAPARADRPALGWFASLHGCPFIFIRTKPRSEWSSERLALLSRAFWLYHQGTLRTPWQKLMEEGLNQPRCPMAEPAASSPQGFTALERRHQGGVDWKVTQVMNQLNSQLTAAYCFKLNN